MGATTDGLRLSVTTLTVAPLRGPSSVDRRRAGVAMTVAPLVGLALGLLAALGVYASRLLLGVGDPTVGVAPTVLPAVVGMALLALLTRGLHLDGLADTTDGLASMTDPERARAIMRQGDVGPLGAAAVVLVVLAQVAALSQAISDHHGTAAMIVSVLASRVCVTVACRRGVRAADDTGLGATVAGTVRGWVVGLVGLASIGLAAAVAQNDVHTYDRRFETYQAMSAVAIAVVVTDLLRRHCARRLGGLTGDVLGFVVEVGMTLSLLVMAVVPPHH